MADTSQLAQHQEPVDRAKLMHVFDLTAIWLTIIKRWKTLLSIVVIGVFISGAYVFFTSPVYRTNIGFVPPTEHDIQNLVLYDIGVNTHTPSEIFAFYKTKLADTNLQDSYLTSWVTDVFGKQATVSYVNTTGEGRQRKTGDWSVRKTITWKITTESQPAGKFRYGSNLLRVSTIKDPENYDVLQLQVDWRDPVQSTRIASHYAKFVNQHLANELVNNLQTGLNNSIANIRSNINFQRHVATVARENQILILEEAARTAQSLGYIEPVDHPANNTLIQITPPEQFFLKPKLSGDPPQLLRQRRYFPMYQVGSVTRSGGITTQGSTSPLYFRGKKALVAEANTLRLRVNDDPYIPELATLLEQLSWLESVEIKREGLQTIGHYETPYPNSDPVHPNITVSLAVGILFGILLGLMTILGREAYAGRERSPL